MTIAFPTSGNFIDYADRFVDPALSFAAGFSMWIGWTAIIASEATFFSVVINYWANDKVPEAVWCMFDVRFINLLRNWSCLLS
jgi:yeast amino acid transporter